MAQLAVGLLRELAKGEPVTLQRAIEIGAAHGVPAEIIGAGRSQFAEVDDSAWWVLLKVAPAIWSPSRATQSGPGGVAIVGRERLLFSLSTLDKPRHKLLRHHSSRLGHLQSSKRRYPRERRGRAARPDTTDVASQTEAHCALSQS